MKLYQYLTVFLLCCMSTSNGLFTHLLGCYGGPCPGTEGGKLKTPNFPAPYPARQSIKYELETNYGAKIRLKFNSFDLEQSPMCQYDSVKIIDSDGAELGQYCGSSLPPTFTSVTNKLTLEFTSDVDIQAGGFDAEWTKVPMSGNTKTITSPNYPANYPSCYQDRVDVFQGKKGSKVKINIANFDLVNLSDLVVVFEGTPSYNDVKALFASSPPGCRRRSSPKKNKKQLRKDIKEWVNTIRTTPIIVSGLEFIAVLGSVGGKPVNLFSTSANEVTSLTSRTNTVSVWLLSDSGVKPKGFEFKLVEL